MSKSYAWRPLAFFPILKWSVCTETDDDWLQHRHLELYHWSMDQLYHTQCHPTSQHIMITTSQYIMIYTFIHSYIHPGWRPNCDTAEVPPVITKEDNSFFIVNNSIMIGWYNNFLSASLTVWNVNKVHARRRMASWVLHWDTSRHPILYQILIPRYRDPIFYPILYPISELPYPNIWNPDIVPDIIPDIGVTIPQYRDPRYCTWYCTRYRS